VDVDAIVDGSAAPPDASGSGGIKVDIAISNVTAITEAKGARIVQTGAGTVGSDPYSVEMKAEDSTNVSVKLAMDDNVTSQLPVFGGLLIFSAPASTAM